MDFRGITVKIKSLDKKIVLRASIITALAVLAAGYSLFGKDDSYASIPKAEAPVSVTTVTIEPETIDTMVSAVGVLSSKNTSVLSSKVMGKVVVLTVNEGDYVSQGKLLLKIESGEISAQEYQARAAYNNAKLQFDRIKRLFDEEAATQMEMDQATLALESARAGLNAAKAMASYTFITAPIAGQVMEKRINLGEMALPGQPVLKIEDNKNLRLEATIKEQDLRFVQPGKIVTVQIDALPGKEIKARVAQVVPAADIRTHSFTVKIDIPADKNLITGMFGKAFFSTGKHEVILVPKSAIVNMSGITGAYIVSAEGTAVFQMIQLGEMHGDSVEAVTGLKAGDKVIMNNNNTRLDGKKVLLAQSGTVEKDEGHTTKNI
ncbi:MAG TPA: efflux RND transporter periplasmic adaptor subunit [Nitrospirota bacterium]|nr:efflux RND transporter periplasmic adaptor subunit [Nitrospirota bacterium]